MSKLETITIDRYTVRSRNGEDMASWLNGKISARTLTSYKAEVLRDDKWENCILGIRIGDAFTSSLEMNLFFSDATLVKVTGSRNKFLPEEYLAEMRSEKSRKNGKTGAA